MTKYIFVTGGVVSGLGKGITAASLGRLLKARGHTSVFTIKSCSMKLLLKEIIGCSCIQKQSDCFSIAEKIRVFPNQLQSAFLSI